MGMCHCLCSLCLGISPFLVGCILLLGCSGINIGGIYFLKTVTLCLYHHGGVAPEL